MNDARAHFFFFFVLLGFFLQTNRLFNLKKNLEREREIERDGEMSSRKKKITSQHGTKKKKITLSITIIHRTK